MKKIFFFTSSMNFGGQERFISRASQILCDTYEVYIIVFSDKEISYNVSGKIISLNQEILPKNFFGKIIGTLKRCIAFTKLLRKHKPVFCMSFGTGPNLINLLCKQRCTKIWPSIRGYASAERITKKITHSLLYRRGDVIICVSKGIINKINVHCPWLKEKTRLLYNPYDCDSIFCDSQKNIPKILSSQCPTIVTVGTLRPEKGYWHLIKAVAEVKKILPTIQLFIVGPNYDGNGERLQILRDNLQLQNNVHFIGWQKNPYSWIQGADAYVLSSVREGFPNALVEAMACHKPVIAADCLTGPREILSDSYSDTSVKDIEHAEYGIIVPRLTQKEDYTNSIPEEDIILANAIIQLLQDKYLQKQYANRAVQRASMFSYATCSKNLINFIKE